MNEVWKSVKGYESLYEVSNMGRVRNAKGKILSPQKRQHGYLCVQLHGKGGHATRNMKTFSIHRLVAEAFIPNPNGLEEVNHLDEDKANNMVDNLEWINHADNTNYGTCQRRRAQKLINGIRSRRVMQFTVDGKFVKEFPSIAEVERQLGYCGGNIHHAASKKPNQYAYGYVWKFSDTFK